VITIASQAQAQAGSDNTTVMTPLRTNQAIQALGLPAPAVNSAGWLLRYNLAATLPEYVHPLVGGNLSGLTVTVTSASAVTVTASLGLSVSADITTSGAGGLDTGTESNSTWYNVWVIWNGATAAAMFSSSATSPTMPVGYVNKVRVGAVRNDASGNLWRTIQKRTRAQIVIGTNPTTTPIMLSGSQGSPDTPTYVAAPLANFLPPTALVGWFGTYKGNNQRIILAPNPNYGGEFSSTNPPYLSQDSTNEHADNRAASVSMLLESTNVYWASSGSSILTAQGWEDSI
jgi:hypothetical protein